jgi:hypothetical protein
VLLLRPYFVRLDRVGKIKVLIAVIKVLDEGAWSSSVVVVLQMLFQGALDLQYVVRLAIIKNRG